MCIAFFTLSQPGYKLILASNRDEFLARLTAPAKWHSFSSDDTAEDDWVLSGVDKGAANGGTWLGITKDLRVGLLTNVRLTPPTPPLKPSPNPPSRGLLLREFLSAPPSSAPGVHQYLSSHYPQSGQYEGFNLLLFSLAKPQAEVGYLTNRPVPCLTDLRIPSSHAPPPTQTNGMPAECFGISNSPMNEPWPKVREGEGRMVDALKEWEKGGGGEKELVGRMFGVLSQSIPITTQSDMLSSTTIPLIKIPSTPTTQVDNEKPRWYGTRTSTVILVKENGETIFVERDVLVLDEKGEPKRGEGERWVEFKADV
ncbi:hypothetical protein I302_102445 [Kwoniella bestiolae CBS 10118]|uniref:Uncharacterized protein n=1 Tax=Kwoniella bestiolae CBS 10118 TaxID=1296100 RepID=A0A1B9GF11_9TREE|nr:hypothetical protein I302_01136 [Kwoniella bestiolae CBS 10118]OCF29627.1 hypothetical protein I302_01136 [Kwoniella bestiolae CBS 10118]